MIYTDENDGFLLRYKTNQPRSYIIVNVCDNPYCGCSGGALTFLTEKEYQKLLKGDEVDGIGLLFGVDDHSLDISENDSIDINRLKEIKKDLDANMSKKEWDLLTAHFYFLKEELITGFLPFESKYDYVFSLDHYSDENLKISYGEIFPLCRIFIVTKKDKEFEIDLQFCTSRECKCKEVNIRLFFEDECYSEFIYDYGTKKSFDPSMNWVIDDIKKVESEFDILLETNAAQIKIIYAMSKMKLDNYLDQIDEENDSYVQEPAVSTKIGRNEPCPCGSGKKYKKCCINN